MSASLRTYAPVVGVLLSLPAVLVIERAPVIGYALFAGAVLCLAVTLVCDWRLYRETRRRRELMRWS